MRVIPAIDIIDGKCVRLTQGDYAQKKIYNENPLEVARMFEDAGLGYLHLVDLDGAKAGRVINWKVIESITAHTGLKVDFGGGIKTQDEITRLFETGVAQVNLGSIAVKNPALVREWIRTYGGRKIILSADVRDEFIAIGGWIEKSAIPLLKFVEDFVGMGIQFITCTDISTDGMLQGPNTALYRKIAAQFPEIKLIASGGVSGLADLDALQQVPVDGVIVGKAIYEGKVSLESLAKYQLPERN